MIREGGCACGAVRYRMLRDPMIVHCCHCTSCQRETGSAFAINALVELSQVEFGGSEPEHIQTPSDSGAGQGILRCPKCHVAVASFYVAAGPKVAFVRVGTLDDARSVAPDVHIYIRSKLPWIRLPKAARAFDELYPINEVWRSDSLQRYRAATT